MFSSTKSVVGSSEVLTVDPDKSMCCFDNELVKESIRLAVISSFIAELDCGDITDSMRFLDREIDTDSIWAAMASTFSVLLNCGDTDDNMSCLAIDDELLRASIRPKVDFTSTDGLDCGDGDDSIPCLNHEFVKESIKIVVPSLSCGELSCGEFDDGMC